MSTAPSMLAPVIGRPRKYQDPDDFQREIDAYFAGRDEAGKPYTMHGLARALDCSRQTLINYEQYNDAPAFVDAIKRARERVAEWTETRLHEKGYHPAGAIFSLKNNFGWVDQQQIEVNRRETVVGYLVSDEARRAVLPTIDVTPKALSPAPETVAALSPRSSVAVSVERGEAKATPSEGVSPPNVA